MSKIQSPTLKLSDAQLEILSAAAKRPNGSLLPFPENLTVRRAALNNVIETLCKAKLAEERPAIDGALQWHRDKESGPLGLFITEAGLVALGIDETKKATTSQAAASPPRQPKTAAVRPRGKARKASPGGSEPRQTPAQSKQDLVIQMLRRQSGVTIKEIIAKTGWQPHSVRGFLSGLVKKKLKLPLVSAVGKDGVRRYRIAAVAASKA